jgi:phosphatidylserine synthase
MLERISPELVAFATMVLIYAVALQISPWYTILLAFPGYYLTWRTYYHQWLRQKESTPPNKSRK